MIEPYSAKSKFLRNLPSVFALSSISGIKISVFTKSACSLKLTKWERAKKKTSNIFYVDFKEAQDKKTEHVQSL